MIILEVIFEDGTSETHTYHHSTLAEAYRHMWNLARLTGKAIHKIHVIAETV